MIIDVKEGLHYASGDREIYINTLKDFYRSSPCLIEKLNNFYESKDLVNYAIEVHSLKGIAKNIGALRLSKLSLEHQLKSQQGDLTYVESHFHELISEWKQALAEIIQITGEAALKDNTPMSNGRKISDKEFNDRIEHITTAIDKYDCDVAAELLEELLCFELPDNIRKKVLKAYTLIQDFEYSAAAEQIKF